MKIAVVGAGHVGVVYATALTALGHEVVAIDRDAGRVSSLGHGDLAFQEPRLLEELRIAIRRGTLKFTTAYADASAADVVFVCVGTPALADGRLDDSALWSCYASIRDVLIEGSGIVVVNKSTVPVGTARRAQTFFGHRASVVASPEFLSEGTAWEDFFHPTRIVIGAMSDVAASLVARTFEGIDGGLVIRTDPESAELAKLAANAFLAMKISFANAISDACEALDAHSRDVLSVIGLDPRIGAGHLKSGLGFGGSCLTKDLAAVGSLMRTASARSLTRAVEQINEDRPGHVVDLLVDRLGPLRGTRIAVLGMAFKRDTDDIRDSPALRLILLLKKGGALVTAFDPAAGRSGSSAGVTVGRDVAETCTGADAIVIATDWPQFAELPWAALAKVVRRRVLLDARGIINRGHASEAGFDLIALGSGLRTARPSPLLVNT